MIIDKNSSGFKDVPLRVKKHINSDYLHKNDFIMLRNRSTPYDANILKNIQTCYDLLKYFASTFYNDKGEVFGFFSSMAVNQQ